MFYLVGDIHGCLDKLKPLYEKIQKRISSGDTIIFLGDYIDRGIHSFEVIEFLLEIQDHNSIIFLKGNHEMMFMDFLSGGLDPDLFFYNGGDKTIRSYKRQMGSMILPEKHREFFNSLNLYYEGDDFIAVHAGLNPIYKELHDQPKHDLVWIREEFYRSARKWDKTIIFGHTSTTNIMRSWNRVYRDEERNIIGIDTGAVYGGYLSCLLWPEKSEFHS